MEKFIAYNLRDTGYLDRLDGGYLPTEDPLVT